MGPTERSALKLGLMLANWGPAVTPEGAAEIARSAEAAGLDSLWAFEYTVIPAAYRTPFPYSPSGELPFDVDTAVPDPLVWLAWVAAHTKRLLLGTLMLILAQRSPLVTAKEVATLDVLSGGRVVLGVGLGWMEEQFEALGVPFAKRGERAEEAIAAMRVLWAEAQPSFEGRYYRFDDARLWPKPLQGRVPIVLGGHSAAAARRAGRIADGFCPGPTDPEQLRPLLNAMRAGAEDAGRDPGSIEVTVGGFPDAETVESMAALGAHRLVIAPSGSEVAEVVDGLHEAASSLQDAS